MLYTLGRNVVNLSNPLKAGSNYMKNVVNLASNDDIKINLLVTWGLREHTPVLQ